MKDTIEKFKKKYGEDATFPLGMIVDSEKKVLLIKGGSDEIIEKMRDFKNSKTS